MKGFRTAFYDEIGNEGGEMLPSGRLGRQSGALQTSQRRLARFSATACTHETTDCKLWTGDLLEIAGMFHIHCIPSYCKDLQFPQQVLLLQQRSVATVILCCYYCDEHSVTSSPVVLTSHQTSAIAYFRI